MPPPAEGGPYLHGEALPTARRGTAEGPYALVLQQNVALHVELLCEALATLVGTGKLLLHSLVDVELVQMQEATVVELLLAFVARQLD